MTAPSPNGQSPDAVREAVARVIHGVIADFYAARGWPLAEFEDPQGAWWRRADQACAGPLAPILAENESLRAERPLTAAALAEALHCFSNPAIGAMHAGSPTECAIAQGLDAVAWRLEEISREADKGASDRFFDALGKVDDAACAIVQKEGSFRGPGTELYRRGYAGGAIDAVSKVRRIIRAEISDFDSLVVQKENTDGDENETKQGDQVA